MKKNIGIIICTVVAVFAVTIAGYSFFEHRGSLAEMETEISSSAPSSSEETTIPEEDIFSPHATKNILPDTHLRISGGCFNHLIKNVLLVLYLFSTYVLESVDTIPW